ncbi:hypothetical protein [Caballeronia zhejiangensis]|uniref:hypothetical protein n=1 Tax=Caballeronia zhejiangensis TaxID=871203 RepID=UPI00158F2A48|nr:hypothetical protein [Caballeronia zhejiangensis]MCG7403051.1 hypothetical protein [Caballeronia zhejiangensis]MCI1043876.1 hypothetical protein [Caballeronia zhejiangensis]
MIDFQQTELRVVHVNVRSEIVGDDERLAMDLRIEMDLPNVCLDKLDAELRPSLYRANGDGDLLGKDAAHMPHLRFPQLGPLTWDGSISPVALLLHLGTKKNELKLAEGKANKLRILPHEGGTCGLVWRLQVHPTEEEAAKVMTLLKHTIKGTLDTSEATSDDGDDDE